MNDEQPYIDRWPMFEEAHSHRTSIWTALRADSAMADDGAGNE
jgi:hypothetical protein